MRKWLLIVGGVIVLLIAMALVRKQPTPPAANSSSQTNTTTETNTTATQHALLGVSFSPQSFGREDLLSFWGMFPKAGHAITWVGSVFDLANATSAPHTVQTSGEQHGLTPILVAHLPTSDVLSTERRAQAQRLLTEFAATAKPAWLGIGNEVNYAYRSDAAALQAFVDWFPGVVAAIHEASPTTKVFTVLQYELLRGLRGGLFGGRNDENVNDWSLLNDLGAADAFALTSYPGLIYGSPEDIPDTYYRDVPEHTQKPIGFSEAGWFRTGPAGWESSAEEQAAFIERWAELTDPLQPPFRIWSFLYDPTNAPTPFDTMGLLAPAATTSPAWEAWQRIVAERT